MKALSYSLRALASFACAALAFWALWRDEYISQFFQIDNFVGALPIALALLFAGGTAVLLFLPCGARSARAAAIPLAVAVLLAAALYPNAVRGNWFFGGYKREADTGPDLSLYAPFTDSALLATAQDCTLTLSDLPSLDGATALYPLYAAFAQATFDEAAYTPDLVRCSKTNRAYDAIIAGECDVAFLPAPSQSQRDAIEAAGAQLVFTPILREAFVFLVADENPVDGLSAQQIRNVYSGKTSRWSTLGWAEGGEIIAFQRPDGSGSQTGLEWVMGELPIAAARPLPDESLVGTNSLMQQIAVEWKGVHPALGYSYRYFATTMYANPHAKLLCVDGVYPSPENVKTGAYPFVTEMYAVTNGAPAGSAKALIDWILSPQGQKMVEDTGYCPVK